jgi:hypothetical protein
MRVLALVAVASMAGAARAAEPEQASRVHFGIGAGAGTAYDGLGIHLEIYGDHLGVYLGTGAFGLFGGGPRTSSYGGCAGVRWYQHGGGGDGVFVSFNGSYVAFSSNYDSGVAQSPRVTGSFSTATVTVGGRLKFGVFFVEGGLGVGFAVEKDLPAGEGPSSGGRNPADTFLIPDVSLAFGVAF